MTVHFSHTSVEVLPGVVVHIDGNSKITASGGTFTAPKPNAFSLPHISCCPGATAACMADCYVHGLSKREAELYSLFKNNERALHRILLTRHGMAASADVLGHWIEDSCAEFRWHVSGDVINDRHARWIVNVCAWSRRTQHWIYTRTHAEPVLELLALAPNLALNMSIDEDNDTIGTRQLARKYGARLCYMTKDGTVPPLPTGSVIFPSYDLRRPDEAAESEWWAGLTHEQRRQVCPADYFGKSNAHRCGPCRKCMRPVKQ